MGYLKAAETDELKLPSDSNYMVQMKRRATWGDTSAAQAAMVHAGMTNVAAQNAGMNGAAADEAMQTAQVLSEVETDAYMKTLVARLLVSWNLTDERDQPLPISVETVSLLEPEDGEFLALEAQKRRGGRPAAQQRPFEKRSGRRSTVSTSVIPRPNG